MTMQDMDGYDEVVHRFLELIPPAERVAGLSPEQVLLTLPDSARGALTDAYLATLSEPARAEIHRRIGR